MCTAYLVCYGSTIIIIISVLLIMIILQSLFFTSEKQHVNKKDNIGPYL